MSDDGVPYNIFLTEPAGAGDYICLLSACREFTRRTGNPVYTDMLSDVIASYNDVNLRYGRVGVRFPLSVRETHRIKQSGDYVNYYGVTLGAMGLLRKGDDPQLDLPQFDLMESRIIIQPFSVFAENPKLEYLQRLVDMVSQSTGQEVYVVGKESTPRSLKGVNYSLLQDGIPHLMRVVQNASLVLTPRSCVAHLAAGYKRPSFVWVPEDGENWHLNYGGWDRVLHNFREGELVAGEILRLFLNKQDIVRR